MIRYITELPSSEWENSFPRPVVLLGSTGSIGVNTLRIIEKHPDLFQVVACLLYTSPLQQRVRHPRLLAAPHQHHRAAYAHQGRPPDLPRRVDQAGAHRQAV